MIYIQTLDRHWSPGEKMLASQSQSVRKAFERYIAYLFVDEVRLAINTQRYKSKWKPLSPQYLQYKIRRGLSPHMWESTTQLKNSVQVMGEGSSTITIGWDKRTLHKTSKIPLYKLARYMEYGTRRIPPRPLFRYLLEYISKNISRYWKKFVKTFLNSNDLKSRHVFKKLSRQVFETYIRTRKLSILSLLKLFKVRR